jgi:hypothetical protein
MRHNALTTFIDKLVRQAKADPKKATVLAVLLLVLGILWARMAGGSSTGPAAAVANISPTRAGGSSGNLDIPGAPRNSNRALAALVEWHKRPISPLSRNLFVINYDFYPQDGSKAPPIKPLTGDGFWDQLAKSMSLRADSIKEHQVLVENLRLQAAQLKVQSTMMGARPKALINGELVGEGSVVASFRVSKIEARRIVLEREGIKLEVRFN